MIGALAHQRPYQKPQTQQSAMSAVSFTTFSLLSQMFLTVILVQQNLLDSDVEMLSQSRGYESSVVAAVSDDSLYIRMAFAHQECQGS